MSQSGVFFFFFLSLSSLKIRMLNQKDCCGSYSGGIARYGACSVASLEFEGKLRWEIQTVYETLQTC